jgi:hypothetical protein
VDEASIEGCINIGTNNSIDDAIEVIVSNLGQLVLKLVDQFFNLVIFHHPWLE